MDGASIVILAFGSILVTMILLFIYTVLMNVTDYKFTHFKSIFEDIVDCEMDFLFAISIFIPFINVALLTFYYLDSILILITKIISKLFPFVKLNLKLKLW